MENIKYFIEIGLSTAPVRRFSEKGSEEPLFPYKYVNIQVNELCFCPFCGEKINGYYCDCGAFEEALVKLQESHQDKSHESEFHKPCIKFVLRKPISEFQIKELSEDEIMKCGLDLWDNAVRHSDAFTEKSFLTTEAKWSVKDLFFLCKDLSSKKVYRLSTDNFDYTDKEISLGTFNTCHVPRNGRKDLIGNYSIEHRWIDIVKFKNWNDVCEVLKKIWLKSLAGSLAFR